MLKYLFQTKIKLKFNNAKFNHKSMKKTMSARDFKNQKRTFKNIISILTRY